MTNPGGDYKTLGLTPGAGWDEVKSAFRRLARTYHPDIVGPDGARKFAEITEAYMSLKDAISPETTFGAVRAGARASYRPPRMDEPPLSAPQSIWRRLWARFFPSEEGGGGAADDPCDFSPARARFVGSAISTAESRMAGLLSRRSEIKERNRTSALICRLRSKHPSVVLLALRQISLRNASDEILTAVMEHFAENIPTTEVLERLLTLFTGSGPAKGFTKALALHARRFSSSDAQVALRWLRRQNSGRECFAPFLSHASPAVVAAALNGWASSFGLPEVSDIVNLLKTEDEAVLVALLRLLRRERTPAWAIPQITRISLEHASPAVRVWASAIVRDRNLS